jgi:hypothetical protein
MPGSGPASYAERQASVTQTVSKCHQPSVLPATDQQRLDRAEVRVARHSQGDQTGMVQFPNATTFSAAQWHPSASVTKRTTSAR